MALSRVLIQQVQFPPLIQASLIFTAQSQYDSSLLIEADWQHFLRHFFNFQNQSLCLSFLDRLTISSY